MSKLWHRRLGHVNFKIMNKLVKGNLVRGLPSKIFENNHTCVACQKGKQHKASYKAKLVSSISQPLQMLHMDLFGPTSVRSINHKTYCLIVTDDFSRFSWVFLLASKDETSGILKRFITEIENQLNHKVDSESVICVVKNPVYHSKKKHIEIRHHFIRDSYEKKLIEMVKIHTDYNVADLLTKAFDVTRYRGLYTNELIEALFEEKLYGTMCINAVDYTTWILRMECKSCQVMKMD
ncbi:putative ribonuclease H-like domain-containing protein [Tanacetum coccineum]